MRTPLDALRSVKKHVASALGDEWEVRLWADDVEASFPLARVGVTGPTIYTGSPVLPDAVMPLSVYCYSDPRDSVAQGIADAMQAEDLLFQAFRSFQGAHRPLRVPLYNYDGVPIEGIDSGSDDRWEHDYLRVTDLSIGHVHDPTDDRLVVASADLRVAWRRAMPSDAHMISGNLVQSIRIEFDATV